MTEPFPTLLVVSRLTEPFERAADVLSNLTRDLSTTYPESLVQGALVMAVAAVEVALSDSLKYYLQNFPGKLPKDQIRNAGEVLPTNLAEQIETSAARYAVALGYRSFSDFLEQYENILSVEIASVNTEIVAALREIKATRNLLLHNALVINEFYRDQAGSKRRSPRGVRDELQVDYDYVIASMRVLKKFVAAITETLHAKYATYTKIAAHKRLWEYLFVSRVMPYDEFWDVDVAADKVVALKESKRESYLSSTELLFLGLWRAHFNGDGKYLAQLNMKRFDRQHLRKFHFVLSIAPSFQWY